MNDSLAVTCSGLKKTFRSGTTFVDLLRGRLRGRSIAAVNGLDLEVRRGEIVGVVGENGAGKSTLLRLIAALLVADSGELDVLGVSARSAGPSFRQRVSYVVSDERSFSWRLTGRQNLDFFAALYALDGAAAKRRIDEALERMALSADADRPVREYSTGMKSRLAFARGLLGSPELWLFDEPTRGMDPASGARIRQLVRDELVGKKKRHTAILASHDLTEIEELCDRVVLLQKGQIRGSGSPMEARALLGVAEAKRVGS